MSTSQPQRLSLPLLEVGRAYLATDFESFEYSDKRLNGKQSILRLHLKNGTSIDLPVTDDQLKHLLAALIGAFGDYAKTVLSGFGQL